MSGDAVDKRFKVVQNGDGEWGILDTVAVEFDGVMAFAAWEGIEIRHWLDEIAGWAIALNSGNDPRDALDWSEYIPRELAPTRIPV